MDAQQAGKLLALTDANRFVGDLASASAKGRAWQFFCECGRFACHALVELTLVEYEAIKDDEKPVLARGHLIDQKERARVLRANAQALRAQAEHQFRRAERNLGRDEP